MLAMRLIVTEERMRKAFIILTGIIFTLLFSACKQFTADIDDYLGYWSSEAFILSSEIDKETHNDGSGMTSVASADDVTVTLKVRNPRSFRFVMPSPSETRNIVEFAHFSGTKPIVNNQYEMKQLSADTLQLVYKDSFLKNSEWGEKDISSTITLYADDGRVFKQTFTVPLKANTRPPKPRYVVAKTKGSPAYYVLCITVPDMDKKLQGEQRLHKDIKRISINGTEYTFSVNTAQTAFIKPDNEGFIMHSEVDKLDGSNADEIPTDSSWVLYYQTNVKVEVGAAKKDYTIRLADEKGVVSEKLDASTNPNKPKIEEPAIAKGRKISGSGSEADPVRIGTDSSGAELSLSSAPASTKVHCTLTEIGSTDSPTSYEGNSVTVPLPLKGAGEKNYKLEYYADGTGFEATPKKTVYYKILQEYTVTFSVADGEGTLKGDYNDGSYHSQETQNGGGEVKLENVPAGTQVGFAARPAPGWKVEGWTRNNAPVNGEYENYGPPPITADITVTVKFEKVTAVAGSNNFAWKLLKKVVEITDENAVITINGRIKATGGENAGQIVIDKNLTIKRADGVASAVLDANKMSRIFKVASGKTLTLENLTLTGGKATGTGDAGSGGAIYAKDASTVNITNCIITGNEADTNGGGLNVEGTPTTITNCTFTGNTAKNGGGIYIIKTSNKIPAVTISGGTIGGTETNEANKATGTGSDGNGGGIYVGDRCDLRLNSALLIIGNQAAKGGGVYAKNATVSMKNGTRIAVNNDVYLHSNSWIDVAGTLTAEAPVARITPEDYREFPFVKVLEGNITGGTPQNYTKFAVTPKGDEYWTVGSDGRLTKDKTAIFNNITMDQIKAAESSMNYNWNTPITDRKAKLTNKLVLYKTHKGNYGIMYVTEVDNTSHSGKGHIKFNSKTFNQHGGILKEETNRELTGDQSFQFENGGDYGPKLDFTLDNDGDKKNFKPLNKAKFYILPN